MNTVLRDIRTALGAVLRTNLQPDRLNVYEYPGGGTSPPRISIFPSSSAPYVEYEQAFGSAGIATVHFELWVECVATDDVSPQILLDAWLAPDSGDPTTIVGALATNPKLGGLVSDVRYISSRVLLAQDGPQSAVVNVDVLLSDGG